MSDETKDKVREILTKLQARGPVIPACGAERAFRLLMRGVCPYCANPLINVSIANTQGPPELSWACIEGCNP